MYTSRPLRATTALSDATPTALGSAGAGTSPDASRGDHRHPMPSAADVGAAATGHGHPVGDLTGTPGTLVAVNGAGVGESLPISNDAFSIINAADADEIFGILGLTALARQETVDPATQLDTAVPVTMGGTGGTNAADARTNLGLGTYATQGPATYNVYGLLADRPTAGSGNLGVTYYATDESQAYECRRTGVSAYAWHLKATGVNAEDIRNILLVQDSARYLSLVSTATSVDATQGTVLLGGTPEALDPAEHAIPTRTQTWTLLVTASVTSGQTGTLELIDLDNGSAVVATISVTGTGTSTPYTASITLPGSARRYELRGTCSGTLDTHAMVVTAAAIKQSWS